MHSHNYYISIRKALHFAHFKAILSDEVYHLIFLLLLSTIVSLNYSYI